MRILALLLALLPLPAHAQGFCMDRNTMERTLSSQYGEVVVSEALMQLGPGAATFLIETWVNADTGTWSITRMDTSGLVCLMFSGGSYQSVTEPEGDPA